jgi:hypothetical protein
MKKSLIALFFIGNMIYAQNMEVTGQMKVKQMPIDNEAQELVVKKTDGTLAKRTVASLTSGTNAVDSVKSFHRDMELLRTICNCSQATSGGNENLLLSKFIIDRLQAHGYTRQDMLNAGFSEYVLDAYQLVVDADGNQYTPIDVNGTIVLKEPLRTTKFMDNTPITFASSNTNWQDAYTNSTPAYSYPNGNAANAPTFGLLYNIFVYNRSGVCPNGYVPMSSADYSTSTGLFSGENVGNGVKENGTTFWDAPNVSSNSSNFGARAAGLRAPAGEYAGFRKTFYPIFNITNTTNLIYTVAVHGFAGTFPSNSSFSASQSVSNSLPTSFPNAAGGTIRCKKLQ